MRSWQIVFESGFLPLWSNETLERALAALDGDDHRLTQGSTTTPPLMCVSDWSCEACDLIAFCSVEDPFESTVGEVEEGFARACFEADQRLGEPAACRWFLNFWDDEPRGSLFEEVAVVIRQELRRRTIKLSPELKAAIEQFPKDTVLKRAAFDWMLEQGATPTTAALESGWSQ